MCPCHRTVEVRSHLVGVSSFFHLPGIKLELSGLVVFYLLIHLAGPLPFSLFSSFKGCIAQADLEFGILPHLQSIPIVSISQHSWPVRFIRMNEY